jgi:hypothetical protein
VTVVICTGIVISRIEELQESLQKKDNDTKQE